MGVGLLPVHRQGILREYKMGREKKFLNPAFMGLLKRD